MIFLNESELIFFFILLNGVARCWAFVSVGVGVSEYQSEDSFVCFARKPRKGLVREIYHATTIRAIVYRCTESYTKVSQTSLFLRLELT